MSNINDNGVHSISEKSVSGCSYKLTLPKLAPYELVERGWQNPCSYKLDEHHASSMKSYQSLDSVENFKDIDMLLSAHDQTQFNEDLENCRDQNVDLKNQDQDVDLKPQKSQDLQRQPTFSNLAKLYTIKGTSLLFDYYPSQSGNIITDQNPMADGESENQIKFIPFTRKNHSAAFLFDPIALDSMKSTSNATPFSETVSKNISNSLLHHIDTYRKSAKSSNNVELQFEFAKFCIESSQRVADEFKQRLLKEGFFWLKKIAQVFIADRTYYLGEAYIHDKNYRIAFQYFLAAAKKFHPQSCFATAQAYEKGYDTKKDARLALQFYKNASLAGFKPAMFRIGIAYLQGELLLKRNVKEAIKFLKRCVPGEPPHCESLYQLHLIYEFGMRADGIHSDIQYSKSVLLESANLGYCPALCKLGKCFDEGLLGFQVDKRESFNLYSAAANKGYPEAEYTLSCIYLNDGNGLFSLNKKIAFDYALLASNKQHVKATYALGYYYEYGIGVEVDEIKSMECYYKAAKEGDLRALKRLRGTIHEKEFEKKNNKCIIS